jgi:hypothetical protein
LAVAVAALSGCEKVALIAPTESTVTLVVSTTVVPVNGTAEIIASVTEKSGTPVHNGTIVTFTSSFGTVEPREARTDNGKAYARFIGSSQSGVAKIGAFSGAAKAEEVEVKVGAAAAEAVVLRAEPAVVSPNGGTLDVIAIVTDASGNPLGGAPVVFSATFGNLDLVTVTTNGDGRATTRLTTNRDTTVRARAGSKEATFEVKVVTLPTVTIALNPTSQTPTVGIPVSFGVTLPTALSAPIQNVFIEFGDGDTLNLGAISGATGFTHTYNSEGGFTVRATAVDTLGQRGTSSIAFVVTRSIPGVTLTAAPSSAAVGAPITFTVGATAAAGSPAITSVQVVIEGTGQVVYSATAGGSFSRSFGAAGVYVLRATATDRSGSVGTATTSVTIF